MAKKYNYKKYYKKSDLEQMFPGRWEQLKKDCLERDGHRCAFIDENGKRCTNKKMLEIHHIYRKKDRPDLAFNLGNTISLCKFHHKKVTGFEEIYVLKFLTYIKGLEK